MGANEDYVGIVKIELGSEREAQAVLKSKRKLGDHPDPSVNRIFLRQSKPEVERMYERSMNAVLDVVDPDRSSLFLNFRGEVKKRNRGGFRGGSRGSRGRGRGRGRGAQGRGRGGQHQSDVNYENAWSPSLAPASGSVGNYQNRGRGRFNGTPQSGPQRNVSQNGAASSGDQSAASVAPFSTFTQTPQNITQTQGPNRSQSPGQGQGQTVDGALLAQLG